MKRKLNNLKLFWKPDNQKQQDIQNHVSVSRHYESSQYSRSDIHLGAEIFDSEDEDYKKEVYIPQIRGVQIQFYFTSFCFLILLWIFFFISITIGFTLIFSAPSQCVVDYTSYPLQTTPPSSKNNLTLRIEAKNCNRKSITQLKGDIYLFYELSNFYQNHRLYIFSRSWPQLRGNIYTSQSSVSSCHPEIVADDGRILHPCGISSIALFNDSYRVLENDGTTPIELDETRETITWSFFANNFKNPTNEEMKRNSDKVRFWLEENETKLLLNSDQTGVGSGVENSHFIVWMNNEALPNFRKLYAKLKTEVLNLPAVVEIKNYYPVTSFSGRKKVVISEVSWYGGYLRFLPITFLCMGGLMLVLASVFTFLHIKQNWRQDTKRRHW